MKLITTLFLTTLTVVGAAAASSTTTSVRAVKGAESPSRKLYSSDSYGGGDNYGSSGYSSGYSSGGSSSHSSSHHSAPKPKTKQTKKPKAAPKPKAKAHPSSSHHSSGGGGSSSSSGYSSYNSWSNDGHDSSGYTEVGYGAVGVLGLAAAILAKKKCSPQDGPTIDATDILEGDYVNEESSIATEVEQVSFVEMTDSEQEKPIRSAAYQLVHTHSSEPGSEYVPNSFGTASPPAEADSVIHEEEEATSGAALV
ncbi:hypothetical protein ACHAXM_002003 [Skeletonema potamos]